jgi:hypothetical protein
MNAPYSPAFGPVYQCRLVDQKKLELHNFYFGQIIEVNVRNDCIGEDGVPSTKKIDRWCSVSWKKDISRLVIVHGITAPFRIENDDAFGS